MVGVMSSEGSEDMVGVMSSDGSESEDDHVAIMSGSGMFKVP